MFEHLLEKLARDLEARSIAYMVIDGQAVLLYGEPRLTRDIDITLGLSADRLPSLREVVFALGLRIRVAEPEDFVRQTLVLPCEEPQTGIRIDFIFSNSPYETEALSRAKRVRVGGSEVRYASVEDLVIHKLVAGRTRDIEDVRGILLKNPTYDANYVRRWLKHFEEITDAPLLAALSDLQKGDRR